MRRIGAVIGGLAVGVIVMLAVLQPWKREEPKPPPSAAPSKASPREEALRLVRLAEAAIGSRELAAAQQRLAEAAALDPDLFEIPLFQGHLEMALHDWSAARRSYTDALKRRPNDAGALGGRAAARFELKEFAGAIEDATAALAADPQDPGALFTRAAAHKELGRNEESLRDWTAYLTRRPRDAQAWANRGNVHARMGRKSGAVTDWEQALALDSSLKDQLAPLISEAKR